MKKILQKLTLFVPILTAAALIGGSFPDSVTFAGTSGRKTSANEPAVSAPASPAGRQENTPRLSSDQARAIALEQIDGRIEEVERDGSRYEVEIVRDGKEYEIHLDAYTGEVLQVEEDDKPSGDAPVAKPRKEAPGTSAKRQRISQEQAKAIALERVGGRVMETELDDGRYEIEVIRNGVEHEVKIDAYTGQVLKEKKEEDEKTRGREGRSQTSSRTVTPAGRSKISAEEARRIALGKVDGRIVELELDDSAYSIEIIRDGIEYEMEINAWTGKIVDFESDRNE